MSLLSLPANLKTWAISFTVGSVACLAAFGGGYLKGETDYAKRVAAEAVSAQTKVQEEQKQERVQLAVRDLARERELETKLATVQEQLHSLKRILNEKPDPDPDVRLRVGDVRMLDDAANPNVLPTGVSDPARIASYEEQTPSDVKLRQFVGTELDIRAQYNALAKRCDALVDWVEVELIQAQLNDKKKEKKSK